MSDWLVHREAPSPNWDERALPVSMVVLHYTGMQTAAEALERMCDPEAKVSAHYMIDEDGTVTQLVPRTSAPGTPGKSYWRGITDVNSASVGIELVNPGHEWGYRPFPEAQMEALMPLLGGHRQAPRHPARQCRRPFRRRAGAQGGSGRTVRLGAAGRATGWRCRAPSCACASVYDNDGAFYLALERFGYDIADGHAAVRAFQRRWRPAAHRRRDRRRDRSAMLFALLLGTRQGRAR